MQYYDLDKILDIPLNNNPKMMELSSNDLKNSELINSRINGFATKAIHVGHEANQSAHNPVVPPMVLSTTFKLSEPAEPLVS